MPSLEFFVVAQSVSIDQRSDRLSIFEVIDSLQPRSFPARIPRVIAVSVWNLNDEDQGKDLQATLQIEGPGLARADFPQNFTAEGATQRMIHHLVNVPVEKPGELLFRVSINNSHGASHRIRVAPADAAAEFDGFLVYAVEQDGQ